MRALRVLDPGPLATIQDLGRYGLRDRGVPVSGGMDLQALRIANLLVGTSEGAACIEITLGGFAAEALCTTRFAVTGADQEIRLNGTTVLPWTSHRASPGDVLTLDYPRLGCRSYLALGGGVDVAPVMGSRSTYLRGGFGGYQGRALRREDVLHCFEAGPTGGPGVPSRLIPPYAEHPVLRVVPGPQEQSFTEAAIRAFFSQSYEVTHRADRMGIALMGPEIAHGESPDIVSDGVIPGSIQVPGSRQPILLMADAQTTGGYAKIGTVASFDLPLAAQLRPGSRVRFELIGLLEAREIYLKREYLLRSLRRDTNEANRSQLRHG